MNPVIDILRPTDIVPEQSSTATSIDQSSIAGGSIGGGDGGAIENERVAEAISSLAVLSNYLQSQQVILSEIRYRS